MSELQKKIIERVEAEGYQPTKPRRLARELDVHHEEHYEGFRGALRDLMRAGRIAVGAGGTVTLPSQQTRKDEFVGTYSAKKGGFGFVIPSDPTAHEDLFVPKGMNMGAISGDIVRARIVMCRPGEGKTLCEGRIVEILERTQKRFVGSLGKVAGEWVVLPDGNTLTQPILAPDAASRHIRVGTKVVIELTQFPDDDGNPAQGVITEVLGAAGEKDVDLKGVIVQHNLPAEFPEAVRAQARRAVDTFDPDAEAPNRFDLSDEIICTIDPDDAKDYDDAISLRQLDDGTWELGVHIADVSHFVPPGSPLDEEARKRGNSTYFPGHVIPMLPEILSNGVCSLQEDVPRLCKSAFIRYDDKANPISSRFANTIIRSRKRLRYREAQALLDRSDVIPHPQGDRKRSDYDDDVLHLLDDMNDLSRRLQKRRKAQGQVVLELPVIQLKLDEDGKVVGAEPEDQSFTHTLIEMFMVEANEAVARLLDSLHVPFLRRTHPAPEEQGSERLRHFVTVSGYKLPKVMDRKAIQHLLAEVHGKPESYAINLAVLKSLNRAVYSPETIGHYALASEHYGHFTSPIRRYADLTIHRLLDAYFAAIGDVGGSSKRVKGVKLHPDGQMVHTYDDLMKIGAHISYTERRSSDAERELRQVKILELLKGHIGDEFPGVVTGITNFGIFVQISTYLVDGLIRYEDLMDDWWDVDERAGRVTGQRTGTKIGIGDTCKVAVVGVDEARRELNLAVVELMGKRREPGTGKGRRAGGGGGRARKQGGAFGGKAGGHGGGTGGGRKKPAGKQPEKAKRPAVVTSRRAAAGATARNAKSKKRGRGKR
ncbi:MAG TPA: ribonuclease R [Tepidisphaeraceae bacterium]|nr:ribonuclease R [Tepidisphaeraceae bacterium]